MNDLIIDPTNGKFWLIRAQNGDVHCQAIECPPFSCSHPVLPRGECCPRCLPDGASIGENGGVQMLDSRDEKKQKVNNPCREKLQSEMGMEVRNVTRPGGK